MELNEDLYREYYQALRQWSEQEEIQRFLDARKLTPEQSWNRYLALWDLLVQFTPGDREVRHIEHLKDLDRYYSIAQKLHDYQMKNGEKV